MDDGLIAAKDDEAADRLLRKLDFQINIQLDGSIIVNQAAYTKRLIKMYGMQDANPVTIPMDKEYAVSAKSQELILNPNVLYREVVEKLKCIWRLEHDRT